MLVFMSEGSAFANEPGEQTNYTQDYNNHTAGTESQARDERGNILTVWRSNDEQNNIWMRWTESNGASHVESMGRARSTASPVVVPYSDYFAVFHTGTDGQIYMARVWWWNLPNGGSTANWSNWQGTGSYSSDGPSVATISTDTGNDHLYMVYRAQSGNSIWGQYYNGVSWQPSVSLGGLLTFDRPAITYNPVGQSLWVAATAGDHQVYLNRQRLGQAWWDGWMALNDGGQVSGQVGFAATANGDMQLAARAYDSSIWLSEVDSNGWQFRGWFAAAGNLATVYSPYLTAIGNAIVILVTRYGDNQVFFKTSYQR